MTVNTESVFSQALELSPIDRAELIERLLSSFEFPDRQEIDSMWATEVESRIYSYDQGELKSRSAKQVFQSLDQ